jgi:tripartite-type tricarboxylate transporter receptor subunit TctC
MKKILSVISLTLFLLVVSSSLLLAAYPEKPVEVIVAFNPGGGTDTMARVITKYAEKYFNGNFAIINKPGAGGEIGFTAISKVANDGYHIGCINPPAFLTYPIQREGVKYRLADFTTIANVVMDPSAIVVKADSPIASFKDLVKIASEKPGELNMAYTGPGSSEAYALKVVNGAVGTEFNLVPFNSTAPGLAALLGGHVDVMILNASEIYSQVQDKKVRVLVVGSPDRIDWLPDSPTYKEEGIDLISAAFRGFAGPKDMQPEHVKALETAIQKALEDPEFKVEAEKMKLPVHFLSGEDFGNFLKEMDTQLRAEWEKGEW